jgi:ribosome-binding protein aMBF1 (putative translation factor)
METIVRKLYKLNEEELEVLKRQMKNLGYSYRSLAKKINICPSYVYDLLSGKRMFNDNTREKFEEAGIYFRGGLL